MAMWSPPSRMYDRSLMPSDVDEHARLGQAQLHQRQQAVAAGEELGVLAVLADEADRLFGRAGPDVVEGGGDHDAAPCSSGLAVVVRAVTPGWSPMSVPAVSVADGPDSEATSRLGTAAPPGASPAALRTVHTLSGLAGIGTSCTPSAGQGVDDGVDDGRGGADGAGLADALDAELVGRRGRDGVAERDRRHVARRRHEVLGERRRLEVAVAVVDRFLEQRLGEALDDAAVHLPVDDQRVDLHAAVVDGDVLQHLDAARSRCRPRRRTCACRTATRSSAGRR